MLGPLEVAVAQPVCHPGPDRSQYRSARSSDPRDVGIPRRVPGAVADGLRPGCGRGRHHGPRAGSGRRCVRRDRRDRVGRCAGARRRRTPDRCGRRDRRGRRGRLLQGPPRRRRGPALRSRSRACSRRGSQLAGRSRHLQGHPHRRAPDRHARPGHRPVRRGGSYTRWRGETSCRVGPRASSGQAARRSHSPAPPASPGRPTLGQQGGQASGTAAEPSSSAAGPKPAAWRQPSSDSNSPTAHRCWDVPRLATRGRRLQRSADHRRIAAQP
jgi:hypothetical protein